MSVSGSAEPRMAKEMTRVAKSIIAEGIESQNWQLALSSHFLSEGNVSASARGSDGIVIQSNQNYHAVDLFK